MVSNLLCRIQYTCKPRHFQMPSEHFICTTSINSQLPAISCVPPFCTWRSNSRPSFADVPVVMTIIIGVAEFPRLGCDNRMMDSACAPNSSTSTFSFPVGVRPFLDAALMPLCAWYMACIFASISHCVLVPANHYVWHLFSK